MSKFFLLITCLLTCYSCQAQKESLLINMEHIPDISTTPIYPRMTTSQDGKTAWKEEYRYMDSIDMYKISYLSDGLKIMGLLVKPKAEGHYPCIIYNRGGNREFGALKMAHGALTMGQLAQQGYVVIASQYRGNSGSEGREEFGGSDVNDVLILPEVLKEIESADTEKIGMYGWSRGGMMTYIALTKTDKIKAAVVGGAVSDEFTSVADRPGLEAKVHAELIPNYKTNREEELEKRSAVMWADKFSKDVPILLLHGNADWRVKPIQSLKMAMAFDKHRIPYRLVMYEGGDHGISEHKTEVNEQVSQWFDRFLKNDE